MYPELALLATCCCSVCGSLSARTTPVCVGAGQGSAQVAATAQQLLEHSLLTELQGVVARTLQGVDMFTQPHLADILGHAQRSQHGQANSSASSEPAAPQVHRSPCHCQYH